MSENKKRLVLLDVHAILHRAYHALPDFMTSTGIPTGALFGLSTMLIKIIEDLKPDYLVACYDLPQPTHRHEVYKEYKAGRKKAEEDLIEQIKRSRDIFSGLNIPIYDKPGFEADDIIGTIVDKVCKSDSEVEIIIASGDMDTLQLVKAKDVRVFTLRKGIKDTVIYDEDAVEKRYGFGPELIPDYKGLCGDQSDNIIGIKGIGEKTATTLLTIFGSIEKIYDELDKSTKKFEKAGITPRIIKMLKENREEAEFSKVLGTIRRDAPIDFILPEKYFRDSIDKEKIGKVWNELEFRTMMNRLEVVLSGSRADSVVKNKPNIDSSNIDKEDLKMTALALWLVDSNITDPSLEDIYNFTETKDFALAKKKILEELDWRNANKVYQEIELPLMPILENMQKRGIKIDRDILKKLSIRYHKELDEIEKKIWSLAGIEFNVSSPKQIGEILFGRLNIVQKGLKKTAGGNISTKESELEKLREAHPIVALILDYRERAKLVNTYIDTIPDLLDKENRLHPRLVQSGTATGRMSSEDPNIQNIPIRSDLGRVIRKAFIAEKDHSLLSFDYSQIELRVAGFLSGDKELIEIFKSGRDVHTEVASRVFRVPIEQVDTEMRRRAKIINFGVMYGMGVNALKTNIGGTRKEAQEFYNKYFETFSGLAKYLDDTKIFAKKNGYTETFFGRRRYIRGLDSHIPYIVASSERVAINAPIQGTEADIVKLAMVRINKYLNEKKVQDKAFMTMQIHDEIVLEVHDSLVEEIKEDIATIMRNVLSLEETKEIPLAVSYHIGKDWEK